MNLMAESIIFNGKMLPVGFVLCSFESSDTTRETGIKLTTNKSALTPFRNKVNLYSVQYEDVLKFSISLIKCNGEKISDYEYMELVDWLTSPVTYCPLTVIDFPDVSYHSEVIYYAVCTGYNEFVVNDVYGLTFNFECNAPYGFSPTQIYKFSGGTPIKINNLTEEFSTDIYPVVTIDCKSTETITIRNDQYPDEVMSLDVLKGQTLTIDNESGMFTDSFKIFTFDELNFNLTWLHLAPGINTITVSGNVTGSIEFQCVRKRGI